MTDLYRRRLLLTPLLAGSFVAASKLSALAADGGYLAGSVPDKALFAGINRIKDPANLTTLEKKHSPVVTVNGPVKANEPFTVEITVGEVLHPSAADHFIEYVEVYANNRPAGRVEFVPVLNRAKTQLTITLEKSATLVVREYCNLHGLWEARVDVTVG